MQQWQAHEERDRARLVRLSNNLFYFCRRWHSNPIGIPEQYRELVIEARYLRDHVNLVLRKTKLTRTPELTEEFDERAAVKLTKPGTGAIRREHERNRARASAGTQESA